MTKAGPWTASLASLVLLLLVIVCALGVVAAQHQARKLFAELQREKDKAQQMEVEWGQLQLEQSTWAMSARVEKVASMKLQMHLPEGKQIRFIPFALTQGRMSNGAQP